MSTPSRRRREGRNAFYPHGVPLLNCPYPTNSAEASDWLDGWREAAAKHESDAPERESAEELAAVTAELVDRLNERTVELIVWLIELKGKAS